MSTKEVRPAPAEVTGNDYWTMRTVGKITYDKPKFPHLHEPVDRSPDENLRVALTDNNDGYVAGLRPLKALSLAAILLPVGRRDDWLEEQRRYMADLPRRARLRWLVSELRGLPRFAYTVRTGSKREPV